jgi:hypothetical protein
MKANLLYYGLWLAAMAFVAMAQDVTRVVSHICLCGPLNP